LTVCAPRRDTHHFLLFLEALVQRWPDHDLILILDHLSIHRSVDVLLWLLVHPQVRFLFQPTYAPGSISLNLGGRPYVLSLSKAFASSMRA
jgi:hypothetical protein